MPRLLQITDKPDPGGGIRRVVEQHRAMLEAQGWDVTQLRLLHPGSVAGTDRVCAPVPSARHPFSGARSLAALRDVAAQVDVIQLHLGFSAISPEFIATAAELAPLVVSLHDISPFEGQNLSLPGGRATAPQSLRNRVLRLGNAPIRRRVWQRICDAACVIHVPSRYLADLAQTAGAPPARIRRVAHALDPEPAVAVAPSEAPPVAVYAGQMAADKGAGLLLEAFARVRTPDARLILLGDGPDLPRLRSDAQPLGGSVEFRGQVSGEDVRRVLAQARLLAHPSLVPEGFGLVGIEAMQLGRPVAGFGFGGTADWLMHEKTGLVATPPDSAALADTLDRLLSDGALADRLGRAAQRHVLTEYAPARIGAQLADMLGDAMAARACPVERPG